MTRAMQGLSGLILVGLLVHAYLLAVMLLQLYLAGPNDVATESWKWHADWGYALGVPILLLMVLTLIGRPGLRVIGYAALLAAMFAAQLVLNRVRIDAPYLPVLYAANGLAMVGLTAAIDRSRTPDDDAQRPDAGPESTRDHRRQPDDQGETGAIAYRHRGKRITTHHVAREISKGVLAGSPSRMTISLVGGPMQARISPRGGNEVNSVRIDKGVNDERVRI